MNRHRYIRYVIIPLFCCLMLAMTKLASKYPTGVFISPVQRQIRLSGTFGELRTNHFHAGLDIKSLHGVSGDPVYAAYDGFISRIRVEEYGYGNALYIGHPNGFTTLYAHLDRFADEIEAYVKSEQYKARSFVVDLDLPKELFPVTKGQYIAAMGNTGYSFGPHLHFEIRHTRGQVPINPLHFGYQIEDHTPPTIQRLLLNEHDSDGLLLRSVVLQPEASERGKYVFQKMVESSAPGISFSVQAYDTHEETPNQNGIYGLQCQVDDMPSFAFTLDEVPFEKTRYMNAHIEYAQKVIENRFFHRCHPLEGNKLPIYTTDADKGRVVINTEQPRHIMVTAYDFNGNASTLSFDIIRTQQPSEVPSSHTKAGYTIADPDQICIISAPGIQVVWPKGSFYEKTPVSVTSIPSEYENTYSPFFEISPLEAPVHYYFDLLIDGTRVPAHLREKVFIARHDPDGEFSSCGGKWIGNNLSASVRQIGTYTLMADTLPPVITALHFGPKMTGWKRMAFKISDNFKIRDRARDLRYNAWVDGQWILMELDGKNGILTHHFDGRITPGAHRLVIRVTDDRGNEAVLEKEFNL